MLDLNFPDQEYSTSNEPEVDVLKADLNSIEAGHNEVEGKAMFVDGTRPMTNNLNMNNKKITNVAKPTADTDGARKIDSTPIATIIESGAQTAPSGYLTCDGATVSRSTFADLFNKIGVVYGAGDGSTTFNVPDKRNRAGFGAGADYTLGQTFGAKERTITTAQMPSHTHKVNPDNTQVATKIFQYVGTGGNLNITSGGSNNFSDNKTISVDIAEFDSGATGGTDKLNILNPGIASNFYIKY